MRKVGKSTGDVGLMSGHRSNELQPPRLFTHTVPLTRAPKTTPGAEKNAPHPVTFPEGSTRRGRRPESRKRITGSPLTEKCRFKLFLT